MQLDGIDIFVKVVQAGSFTKAAKLLGMPLTTVSGKVALLEKRLGVTLLHRTTRKLNLTEAGEAYFRRCLRVLDEVEAAEKELTTKRSEPEGTLRITSTIDVGHIILPPIIKEYLKRYPKMRVELVATNRLVDLISEGVDLAIRIGSLKDSTMVARRFLESQASLWASAAYVKKHGLPKHPRDLEKHQCISFSAEKNNNIRLSRQGETQTVAFPSRIVVDDMESTKAFVMQGDGIGLIPQFLCEEEARQGKLIPVLPQWTWGSLSLSFVYPAQRFVAPKVQSFIECALKSLKD
ncbi:LysR family transcriptional regulator [Bdellovibrio sp. BCCA]|uniref:LysR family transcriptional regulator n=1 Tax=Bdellovibrio sp. BCCA TaxID=3136281 RepID=UPI0030F0B462